jgi:hypothetical protein
MRLCTGSALATSGPFNMVVESDARLVRCPLLGQQRPLREVAESGRPDAPSREERTLRQKLDGDS